MIDIKLLIEKKEKIKWDFDNMMDWFRIELTYTSNAIEGSTFTRHETAVFLNNNITVGGKTLTEHLEVVNHANAFDYIVDISKKIKKIQESHILIIHEKILENISKKEAGIYISVPVRIVGSNVILPNYQKVPKLMLDFVKKIQHAKDHPIDIACFAHFQLVTIHPFIDGNGRTARLLMNLILLMAGFPPIIISKKDRLEYIKTLEKAQITGNLNNYKNFMYKSLDKTLDICLKTNKEESKYLFKIGEVAKRLDVPISTIRFWILKELIKPKMIKESGYQLFDEEVIKIGEKIKLFKKKRFNLHEIKEKIKEE